MAGKSGLSSFLLPALGIGALATGGLGLPALLGEGAAAGAEAGGLGAEAAGLGGGAAATLGEATPELTAGLLGAGETAGGSALSLGATPLTAGLADTLGTAGGLGEAGLNIGAPSAAGGLSAGAGIGSEGLGLIGPQAGETINSLAVGTAPTDLTAGATAAAPVTTTPLAGAEAAGQPLTSGAPGFTNAAGDFSSEPFPAGADSGGGILGGAQDAFNSIGGLKGLSAIASAGLLGSELLKGPQAYPQQQQLAGQAGNYLNLGNQLAQPIQTGALPTGANAAIDLSTAANKARISSQFANLGLGGSTMEAQAIGAADQQAAGQKFTAADQLLEQAGRFSSLGTQTTQNLLKTTMDEDAQYRAALANFAKALAGTGAAIG